MTTFFNNAKSMIKVFVYFPAEFGPMLLNAMTNATFKILFPNTPIIQTTQSRIMEGVHKRPEVMGK